MSDPGSNTNTKSSSETISRTDFLTPDLSPSPFLENDVAENDRMPHIIKLSKSKGANVLNKYYSETDGMFFQTFNDAHHAMDNAQWSPPMNDHTIPQNDGEDRRVVCRLVAAFMDTNGAMDTEGNAYRKRMTPGTNVSYEPWTIERCAWEVLRLVKSIHTDGFTAPIFDADVLKAIGQTEHWTFEDRITMICRVLKISKSVAVTLMKHEKIWTIIGAPHKLYNSTLVNTASNVNRNKWVKAGREAEKGPILPRIPNLDGLATQRRRSYNNATRNITAKDTTSRRKSGTFALPSLVAVAPSSSSTSPKIDSKNEDVEMVDAVPDELVEDEERCKSKDEANENTKIGTVKLSFSSSKNNSTYSNMPGNIDTPSTPSLSATSPLQDNITATSISADIEAARMLLGLGLAGRIT